MRVAIYARVSTDDKGQDPENQLAELRAWCAAAGHTITLEYVDHETGRKGAEKRKQFATLFDDAAKRKFDCAPDGRFCPMVDGLRELLSAQNTSKALAWVGSAMFGAFAAGAPIGSALDMSYGFTSVALMTMLLPAASGCDAAVR